MNKDAARSSPTENLAQSEWRSPARCGNVIEGTAYYYLLAILCLTGIVPDVSISIVPEQVEHGHSPIDRAIDRAAITRALIGCLLAYKALASAHSGIGHLYNWVLTVLPLRIPIYADRKVIIEISVQVDRTKETLRLYLGLKKWFPGSNNFLTVSRNSAHMPYALVDRKNWKKFSFTNQDQNYYVHKFKWRRKEIVLTNFSNAVFPA